VSDEAAAHSELPPSSSDKWLVCHAWRRLTHGIEDTSSAAAEEGTFAHERLAEHLLGQVDLSVLEDRVMYDYLIGCAEWVQDQPGELFVETRLDYGGFFGYVDLTGTSDLVIVEKDRLTIGDLKYGLGVVEVPNNPQMLTYLVGAVHRFGRRGRYRLVILQPRAWHTDGPIREWELTDDDLRVFEALLEAGIKGNYDPKSEATPGDHCQHYCKALSRCREIKRYSLERFKQEEADV
jgi:hypothetical protein